MAKNVLILSTSFRIGSNSDTLADAFYDGAKAAGHTVEKISLSGKNLRFCRGCLACQKTQQCILQDDANLIVQKMKDADVLVFATPIYYYEMCGQMKTLLDRANPLFPSAYAFREIYLLAAAAEDGDSVWQRAAEGLKGWIACFPKARLAGVVFGGNAEQAGALRGSDAVRQAYETGKSL